MDYKSIALAVDVPSKPDLVAAMKEVAEKHLELMSCKKKLTGKLIQNYCPYSLGEKVVITLRMDGTRHVARIKRIDWDTLTCDYSYVFRIKGGRLIPSGHVTDISLI